MACEFAAFHCLKYGEHEEARKLFKEAKGCYQRWGSQMKMEYVDRQLEIVDAKQARK